MSETFADAARRLSGAAGRMLGWPPPWFWNATPSELAAILFAKDAPAEHSVSRETLEHMMERDSHG
ncbi:phage tail assembly chaperone [Aurantiacibacter atlanticus]